MEKFKDTNLIVAQDEKILQLNEIEELIEVFFGNNYKSLSNTDKLKERYKKALFYAMFNNMDIVYSKEGIIRNNFTIDKSVSFIIDKSFFIDDEITFFLSLCKINYLRILEKMDSNIFISDEDKEDLKDETGNYVIINNRVDKILIRYLKK